MPAGAEALSMPSGMCSKCGSFFLNLDDHDQAACTGKKIPTTACQFCKKLLLLGAPHDCPVIAPSAPPADEVDEEQGYRERIRKATQQTSKVLAMSGETDVAVAREIFFALKKGGLPTHGTIAVAQMSDGQLYFACSGQPESLKSKTILATVGQLMKMRGFAWRPVLCTGSSVVASVLISRRESTNKTTYKPGVAKHVNEVCAEPKLVDALAVTLRYLTVLWIGTEKHEYPLLEGETGPGSPMLPCMACWTDRAYIQDTRNKKISLT